MKKHHWFLLLFLLTIIIVVYIYKNIKTSVFLKFKDRTNLIFYSENTRFYSLAKDDVNYLIKISPEVRFFIPGGYGFYRLGGLYKLIDLEKKPEIFSRSFSVNLGLINDLYFYPKKVAIYYDKKDHNKNDFPSFYEIFFYKGSANFLDRLIIFFIFFKKNIADYRVLFLTKDNFFREDFLKKYQGYFYKKTYRQLRENIQILYKKSYSTALLISQILDGEGIRVVDLTEKDSLDQKKTCFLYYKDYSIIIEDLKNFFNCQIKKTTPEISDIILELNELELIWSTR